MFGSSGTETMSCRVRPSKFLSRIAKSSAYLGGNKVKCKVADLACLALRSCVIKLAKNGGLGAFVPWSEDIHDR